MKWILLVTFIGVSIPSIAQLKRSRYILWLTPTGKNYVTINGLAVGLAALPIGNPGTLRVNGLNAEINPTSVLTIFGGMIYTMLNPVVNDIYAEEPEQIQTEIRGLSISPGLFEEVETHGVSVNLINSYASISRGVEMSLIMNSNFEFSGVQLSGIGNRVVKGKGLQVGLFNSCQDCHVVQIGILNRIGNRVLPLVNVRLKRRNELKER